MRKKLIGLLTTTLILGSASAYATTVPLDEVTVKAGGYNSISLEKLKTKYVYDIQCNVMNVNRSPNLTMGVEQRYGTPYKFILNGKEMTKSPEDGFYQANLDNESNELILKGVTDKSGSFLGDYLYFHNDAPDGSGADIKVSNCIAKPSNP